MLTPSMEPLVWQRDDGLQLCYQLPHRIYSAKSYPILSPNGSAIIIYGFDNGLRIIWRGGKGFRPLGDPAPVAEKEAQKPNGSSTDDAVMIIDSDDEVAPESPKTEGSKVEFNDEEIEVDSSHPFEYILRSIDIPLGTKVLSLAVPRFLPKEARSSLDPFPPVLSQMIIVSAICADYSTKVVALPLTPPHPSYASSLMWGIQTFSISSSVSQQGIPLGVSITFTLWRDEDDHISSKPQSGGTSPKHSSTSRKGDKWDLLIATHSAESSGMLLIYRLPILQEMTGGQRSYSFPSQPTHPIQRVFLPTPAKSICFNPSSYPSEHHSNLLVTFSDGHIKIFSCLPSKSPKASRSRRGSNSAARVSEPEGKWLITLYPGFEQSTSGPIHRKEVVDSKWVLGGRAVMVLMADGEWGVWDIEGAGPGTEAGPLHGQQSVHGVTGGSLTLFSVSGRITESQPTSKSHIGGLTPEQRPKFAPMTPSTRRIREGTLLKGTQSPSPPSSCGEISVVQTNSARDPNPDESVVIRHGDHSAIIPSLLSLWRTAVKATGTFDNSSRCKVSNLGNVSFLGERMIGIDHMPAAARKERESERRAFDILILCEHRFIILAPKLTGSQSEEDNLRTTRVSERPSTETDQMMLSRGELNVDGMDRVLSRFAAGPSGPLSVRSPLKRARLFS